ncbi:hypothetical protein CEP52_014625 [Fusarium oligoseptatum]|uniref:Phytanoyl-CoA dioxygenase family protein n=1 Tax=Fusarium oligoseptatum TaxID=2604345 RepID=A0A428SKE5_9HYPO|nr:hypothetical protein CEP52_014625 [Fusarium oligoseptatum]
MNDNKVLSIEPTVEEKATGIPSAATIAAAVSIIQRDGIVVIEDVVDHDHLDQINNILSRESEELYNDNSTHFNFGAHTRNISQPPPLAKELLFDDIWANPFTNAISANILGPNPVVNYANGNCALKSEARQEVHGDVAYAHLEFPYGIVANYYLVDTDFENGATEIWIGSHRNTTMADHIGEHKPAIREECLEERRKTRPPIQPKIKKGSVVIRDIRLWHAGMPNHTDQPRIMLAFGIVPWYFNSRSAITLPESAKELVEEWEKTTGVKYATKFVEGTPDHRKTQFTTGFRPNNPSLVYNPMYTAKDLEYLALDKVPLVA